MTEIYYHDVKWILEMNSCYWNVFKIYTQDPVYDRESLLYGFRKKIDETDATEMMGTQNNQARAVSNGNARPELKPKARVQELFKSRASTTPKVCKILFILFRYFLGIAHYIVCSMFYDYISMFYEHCILITAHFILNMNHQHHHHFNVTFLPRLIIGMLPNSIR